jgi:DNA-binding response OmpR family regulator
VTQESNESFRERILCVEDDRDTCEVLRFVMTDYEFTAVHSIEEALKLIEKSDFDLYVLDNWLPDGSGIELCKRIRSSGTRAPILFTSAIGQRQDIETATEAGADRYLVKPYEPEKLVQTIKELLKVEQVSL